MTRTALPLVLLASLAALSGCVADDDPVATAETPLVAQCVADTTTLPDHVWTCPDDLVVECASPFGTSVSTVYVEPPTSQTTCSALPPLDVEPGPFSLGDTPIVVSAGPDVLCETTLTVVDTSPPSVTPHTTELWPPNHEMHTIDVDDCVTVDDACDDDVSVRFTHVSSDESPNATGDGNTDADVDILDCDEIRLRAERQGDDNGRVYVLGFIATDAAGNTTQGTCQVEVPHDQGVKGQAVADTSVTATTVAACAP